MGNNISFICNNSFTYRRLNAIKNISVAASFPFLFILAAICYSLQKVLKADLKLKEKGKSIDKK